MKQTPERTPKHSNRLLDSLPTALMLCILAIGFIFALFALPKLDFDTDNLSRKVLRGGDQGITKQLDNELNDAIGFKDFSRNLWGLIGYRVFKEGRKGVLIGDEGWLYSDEEFCYFPNELDELDNKVDFMLSTQETLKSYGAELVIAFVPAKARVYPEYLGKYKQPSYTLERYGRVLEQTQSVNLNVIDLYTPLKEAKTTQSTFLRTDTHWTIFGANLAAQTIASYVRDNALLASIDSDIYETTVQDTIEHSGDLLKFIPLGNYQHLGPQPDNLQKLSTEKVESDDSGGGLGGLGLGGLGLFDSVSIPVTLIGTSYSANTDWNFEGALKVALGSDILNLADEGKGPIIPMQDYLKSVELQETPPELVIWEIPERFLPVDYSVEPVKTPCQ